MRIIIAALVAFFAVIIGLSLYLAPNDLLNCDKKPSPIYEKPCQPADAIVTVSGGDTAARTKEAITLYQNSWAPKLIFSGAAQDKTGPSNAEAMRRLAVAAGVPSEDIIVEEYSSTTKENAENTQAILRNNNITSVILVTSAYHQRRASLEFEKRSSGAVTIRNHPAGSDNQWSRWWWLSPGGWALAASEFVKIIAFYLGGTK